jgi:hypothetical protein
MRGTACFQTDTVTSSPIMFLNGSTGFVGVNTDDPRYGFHVDGTAFVRSSSYFRDTIYVGPNMVELPGYSLQLNGSQYVSSNVIVNGNVGIGTTNPHFRLDVVGDINFTGDLYQRSSKYLSSQWSSSGNNIGILSGSVGIGTTNPLTTLDVRGTISAANIGIGTTTPLQSLHVHSRSFFNGSVGIGTTIPLAHLHVQTNSLVMGSVGVGTTSPRFPLHVVGDLNFDGNLFQNGTRYAMDNKK